MKYLPDSDRSALALGGGCVLDIHATRAVGLLVERGIKIPLAITPSAMLDTQVNRNYWGSVYYSICDVKFADLFFKLGFRDLDVLNSEGRPPLVLQSSLHSLDDIAYL
jgi:hypothetical protein